MTGPNWPNSGEIDIIEGVNTASQDQMTMHTSAGCTLAGSDCQGNNGCPIKPDTANDYGTNFNNANGGVYAMEWTSGAINIWFFPRGSVPGDISGPNPNPSGWGAATASFVGGSGCDIDSHFMNNNIVFDTTFCGDWAGAVWGQDSTCSALAGTCQDYVQNHPEAFAESYWTVNSLKVYQDDGSAPAALEAVASSSSAISGAVFAQVTTASGVAQSTTTTNPPPVAQYTSQTPPSSVQAPPRTHTHGELFESSETGVGYVEIVPREAPPAAEVVKMKKANNKVSRHLRNHVHHLHHT